MRKMKFRILFLLCFIGLIISVGVSYSVNFGGTKDGLFKVEYDASWKLVDEGEFILKHKKTESILSIQSKMLEDSYVDTDLKYIINDIMYSIEKQNKGYKLINMNENVTSNYQSYSYLYENDNNQVLVNVNKKGNKLIIAYYEADSDVYDIVLDSVDTILSSLKIS